MIYTLQIFPGGNRRWSLRLAGNAGHVICAFQRERKLRTICACRQALLPDNPLDLGDPSLERQNANDGGRQISLGQLCDNLQQRFPLILLDAPRR
jgi:hypothetical protein